MKGKKSRNATSNNFRILEVRHRYYYAVFVKSRLQLKRVFCNRTKSCNCVVLTIVSSFCLESSLEKHQYSQKRQVSGNRPKRHDNERQDPTDVMHRVRLQVLVVLRGSVEDAYLRKSGSHFPVVPEGQRDVDQNGSVRETRSRNGERQQPRS